MDKPNYFDAEFITKTFFPLNWEPSSINSGQCYDWAYYAYCLFPEVELWSTDYHAWVKVGALFFDSETHQGIDNYNKMPCTKRCGWCEQSPIEMTVDQFKEAWNHWGAKSPHHWLRLARNIRDKGLRPART